MTSTEDGALTTLFNDAWFMSDLAFAAGMGIATFTPEAKAFVEWGGGKIAGWNLDDHVKVPQRIEKSIKAITPKVVYWVIMGSLLFCLGWNVLTNIFATDRRSPIFNFLYIFYPYFTKATAHNILLHDDYKEWKPEAKRLHVWIPVNFEDAKVFPTKLTYSETKKQVVTVDRSIMEKLFNLAWQIPLALVLHQKLPSILFCLAGLGVLNIQNSLNLLTDLVLDKAFLHVYRNRFSHMFGNYWGIVKDNEKHDHFGRQYQYFAYSNKPLEKVLKKEVFEKARKKHKLSRREAIAATYLARGAVVITSLYILNLLNYDLLGKKDDTYEVVRFIGALLPYVAYYGIHAAVSYFLDWYEVEGWQKRAEAGEATSRSADFFKLEWKRWLVAAGEGIIAGHLFYKPIMDLYLKA